jgi:hypothetical protein
MDAAADAFVAEALNGLAKVLKASPLATDLEAIQLPKELADTVDEELRMALAQVANPPMKYHHAIARRLHKDMPLWSPLLVYCKPDSALAQACLTAERIAKWGLTWPGFLAVVYGPRERHLIWHEALHLWNVDECYDKDNLDTPPRCGVKSCAMGYVPGDTLCDNTLCDLKRFLGGRSAG